MTLLWEYENASLKYDDFNLPSVVKVRPIKNTLNLYLLFQLKLFILLAEK